MEPSFSSGDYLIVDEISYRFKAPLRGEIIIFESPTYPFKSFIKRVIGLPGETVEIREGKIIISNAQGVQILDESEYLSFVNTSGSIRVSLGQEEYFVLGDNRSNSFDSRRWGTLPAENIIGKVFLRLWPFDLSAKIAPPDY